MLLSVGQALYHSVRYNQLPKVFIDSECEAFLQRARHAFGQKDCLSQYYESSDDQRGRIT
jgi:hypothetical protein